MATATTLGAGKKERHQKSEAKFCLFLSIDCIRCNIIRWVYREFYSFSNNTCVFVFTIFLFALFIFVLRVIKFMFVLCMLNDCWPELLHHRMINEWEKNRKSKWVRWHLLIKFKTNWSRIEFARWIYVIRFHFHVKKKRTSSTGNQNG